MQSTEQIKENQSPKRGGYRPGSGRRAVTLDERWIESRGIRAATAAEILTWHGEAKLWQRVLASEDLALVLRALMYLTDRRDGKPAQQINVTSQSLTFNVSDIDRAKAIVREIRGEPLPAAIPTLESTNLPVPCVDAGSSVGIPKLGTDGDAPVGNEIARDETMLSGDEGGKKDGVGM